jgi:hypothetical protein
LLDNWEQKSATELAALIWTEHRVSVSRNSVIGRLHRMGLKVEKKKVVHPKTGVPVGSIAYKIISGIKRKLEGAEVPQPACQVIPDLGPRNLPLLELGPQDCRWPTTERLPHAFCALQKMAGSSYCRAHHRLSVGQGTPSEQAAHKLPREAA